jgi:hypothetical protein
MEPTNIKIIFYICEMLTEFLKVFTFVTRVWETSVRFMFCGTAR